MVYTLDIPQERVIAVPKQSKAEQGEGAFRGDRLKMLREKMKLTQPEFEKYLGLSVGAISRYERGEIEPGSSQLKIIASRLEVSVDYLLGLTDTIEPDSHFKGKNRATPENAKEAKFLDRLRKGEVLELINELSGDALVSRNSEQKPPKNEA